MTNDTSPVKSMQATM